MLSINTVISKFVDMRAPKFRSNYSRWILVAQCVRTRHADRESSFLFDTRQCVETDKLMREECAKRWRHSLDPNIDHSEWTDDEDRRLVNAVKQFGHNWRTICTKEFPSRSTTDLKNR